MEVKRYLMLNFNCKNCGSKINIPKSYAGKEGKCPKCGAVIIVPEIEDDILVELKDISDNSQQSSQPEIQLEQEATVQSRADYISVSKSNLTKEEPPKRRLPSIIDVFLYPMSAPGLATVGVFWILSQLIVFLLPIHLIQSIATFIVACYMLYFFVKCVRNSAIGEIRIATGICVAIDISDAVVKTTGMIVSTIICWGPLVGYIIYKGHVDSLHFPHYRNYRTDIVVWMLCGYGFFFSPISLLAIAMLNSISALNPFLWITSISRTFFQYSSLLLSFLAIYFLDLILEHSLRRLLFSSLLFKVVDIYLMMVQAHLIGRFYYRNFQKLNWEE